MFDSLKTFIILSIQEIMQIKTHIAQQNTHLPSSKRAELLSIAIHTHLDQHLTGVDSDYRTQLRHRLLSATVAQHNYTISQLDVLTSISALDLDQSIKTELAKKWLHASTTLSFTYEDLASYLNVAPPEAIAKNRSPWVIVTLCFMIIVMMGYTLLPRLQPIPAPTVASISRQNLTKNHLGLYALDRVYLITEVTTDDVGQLNVVHQTVPFGLNREPFPFPYKTFDYFAVKNYIADQRKGLIGSSLHFNTIITLAQANDIDPLFLFAIIGQEQAFVPTGSYRATDVINNPFNVFNSWLTFNTSLEESTQIAINTIKNRMRSLPEQTSPFIWLNGIYAEDENWHVGVRLIYQHLQLIGRENL